jgi:fibronectin-binding autotransporter adhesin
MKTPLRSSILSRLAAAAILAVILALLTREAAAQGLYNANYLGGGIWEQDANWSTTVYPQNGRTRPDGNGNPIPGPNPFYDVTINNPALCTLGIGVRVQTVNIFNGSTLNLATGGYVWANNGFGNAGLITLNSTGNFSGLLRAGANSNVVSGGEIFMSDHGSNSVTAGADGKILTISGGGRIRGAGAINQYHGDDIRTYFGIINHGLIEAVHPNNPLNIQLHTNTGAAEAMTNTGLIRASGNSVLRISSPFGARSLLQNTGTIAAIDNGTVRIAPTATISGGTLATAGNGTIRGNGPSAGGGVLHNVTNTGIVASAANEIIQISGTFTNNGLVSLDGNAASMLVWGADATLGGTGLVSMTNGSPGIAGGDFVGRTLTVGPSATIQALGQISTNNSNFTYKALNLVNQGLIETFGNLTLFVDNSSATNVANPGGTLRANGAAALMRFSGPGLVNNTGGTIASLDGGTVRFAAPVTVEGGTLATSGTGTIRGDSAGSGGGVLANVTNNGTVASAAGEIIQITGTFTNNSLVNLDGNGASLLVSRGNATIAGSGVVSMNTGSPGIAGGDFVGRTLTVAPGATIRARGQISTNNSNFTYKALKLVNQGLIETLSNVTIFADSNSSSNVANPGGILRAAAVGSQMYFAGVGTVDNTGGTIEALDGGNVRIAAQTTVEGGVLATSGTGAIRGDTAGSNGGLLRNVTNTGTIAMTGGEYLHAAGTLTNNGVIRLEGQGSSFLLRGGDLALGGNGLTLASTSAGRPGIAGGDVVGRTFTLRPGATIRGTCTISTNNSNFAYKGMHVVNQGLIEATGGITHFFDPGMTATNTGIYRSNGPGSAVEFHSPGALDNTAGTLEAVNGGSILFNNSARLANLSTGTLTGGTYRVADNGGATTTIQLNGGTISTNNATILLSGPNAQFPGLALTQNNGTFALSEGATRTFAGNTAAAARSNAPAATFPNAGTIVVGRNSRLNINGDFAQGSNGKLEVIISSTSQPAALSISGTAALAGRLEVKLAPGFTPPAGTTLPLLSAGSVTGGFTQVTGANVTYGPNGVTVQPTGNSAALQMTGAVSRKAHGSVGAFDIALPAVECRRSNGQHTLVFTFSNTIASATASVVAGTATLSESAVISGNTVTLNLTGVPDAQQVEVKLAGVTDVFSQTLPDTTVALRVLQGDTNGDATVNAGDSLQTRGRSGQPVDATNFRSDVNTDGALNSGDSLIVRAAAGRSL